MGSSFGDTIIADDQWSQLFGGDGNDTIDAGNGADQVWGGAGADSFILAQDPSAWDVWIRDFAPGVDHLHLDARVMPALGASGNFAVNDPRFYAAAGASSGHDADDRIIYDTLNGGLYYDPDGNGSNPSQIIATFAYYSGGVPTPLIQATDLVVDNAAPGVVINGTSGNDSLVGTNGNDTINGLDGNDTIDGGAGADSLVGGAGDDVYFVDNAGDIVVEQQNAGVDEVRSSAASYTLGDFVNNLTLLSGAVNGTGNAIENVITGNAATNRLSGGDGNDTLTGAGGNDTLSGGTGSDHFIFNVAPGSANAGVVTDFASGTDVIRVDGKVMPAVGASGSFASTMRTIASSTTSPPDSSGTTPMAAVPARRSSSPRCKARRRSRRRTSGSITARARRRHRPEALLALRVMTRSLVPLGMTASTALAATTSLRETPGRTRLSVVPATTPSTAMAATTGSKAGQATTACPAAVTRTALCSGNTGRRTPTP